MPFFPPKIIELMEKGPPFVLVSREDPTPLMTPSALDSLLQPTQPVVVPLSLTNQLQTTSPVEFLERKVTLEMLRNGNQELQNVLASLRAPKIEAITL